jgi:hypothetical protein
MRTYFVGDDVDDFLNLSEVAFAFGIHDAGTPGGVVDESGLIRSVEVIEIRI